MSPDQILALKKQGVDPNAIVAQHAADIASEQGVDLGQAMQEARRNIQSLDAAVITGDTAQEEMGLGAPDRRHRTQNYMLDKVLNYDPTPDNAVIPNLSNLLAKTTLDAINKDPLDAIMNDPRVLAAEALAKPSPALDPNEAARFGWAADAAATAEPSLAGMTSAERLAALGIDPSQIKGAGLDPTSYEKYKGSDYADMDIDALTDMIKPRMTQADRWKSRAVVVKYWNYRDEIYYSALAQG